MQLTMTLAIALAAMALTMPAAAQSADRAEVALQGAMKKEKVDGDLKGAIEAYRKVAQTHRGNRSVAARALVQIGQCYEKLGDAESRKAYEQVLREFGDQPDPAATARTRLAALMPQTEAAGVVMRRVFSDFSDRAVQISPDKRWLVHLRNKQGQYYLRDNNTGQSRQFTHRLASEGLDVHNEVYFSNDSRQIAYVIATASGREIRIGAVDQPGERTVFRSKVGLALVGWLPDGARLLVRMGSGSGDDQDLHVLSTSDGSTKPIKQRVGNASVSSDGKLVAYSVGGRQIRLLNLDDMSDVLVTDHPAGNWLPRILPRNQGIVFRSDRRGANDLWLQPLSNGKPAGPPEVIKANTGDLMEPAGVANDGIVYYRGRTSLLDTHLGEYDIATGKWLVPPRKLSPESAGMTSSAAFTPDGRRVSHLRAKGPYPSQLSLVLHSLSGTEEQVIPTDLVWVEWHTWLPDGKAILLQGKALDQLRYGIYRFDLSSRQSKLLRSSSSDGWSNRAAIGPDGVAYLPFWNRLVAFDLADGTERLVTATNGGASVSLSPDGKSLAFAQRETESMAVLSTIGTDGSGRRDILRREIKPGGIGGVGGPIWLRDGKTILFMSGSGNVWWPAGMHRIDAAGGTPVSLSLSANGTHVDRKKIAWAVWSEDGRHVAVDAGDWREELYAFENIVPERQRAGLK